MSEEGTLELRIDRFTEFIRSGIFSSSQEMDINGLPWKIGILTPTYTYPTLNITLQCNEGHNEHWECTANVTFHIVSQKEGVQDIVRRLDHCFYKRGDPAYLEIKHPDVLFDPDNGFIKDDTVILRAHVKVGTLQTANFTSSISDPPDGVLIVGTNRIPIHKTYLSYYSEYFKTMFRSKFKEGREEEIVLEEIGYEDMLALLSVIYPSNAPITDGNIKAILKLADRFLIPTLFERCKNELRTSTAIKGSKKLLLAQQYNFKDLQVELAQEYKTVEQTKELKSEPEYQLLDCNTRALLFDSIMS